jgi:hypothetical protein
MDVMDLLEIARWYIEQGLLDAANATARLITSTVHEGASRAELIELLDTIEITEEPNDSVPPVKNNAE